MMSDMPPNVRPVQDRHGKLRYRFRRKGWASAYLPGQPGAAEFHEAYATIIKGGALEPVSVKSANKVEPRSLDDLFLKLKATGKWKKQADTTSRVYGRMLERFNDRVSKSGRRYGDRLASSVTVAWLDNILAEMSDTPAAANNLRKILKRLFDRAIKLGWRTDNPASFTDTYREGEGYHTWTEEEIEQYRTKHELGTMARFAMELALNTAARRCNVATLTRDDIANGRIIVDHAKNGNNTSVPMLATTRAALDALPAQPIRHLVTTSFGKPFSVAGLGNKMREWCNDAGLQHCSMHGLRKAMSRRVAESGGTDAEGQAITGHKKSETFVRYRAKANRVALADHAMSNLQTHFDVQPYEKDDISND